MSSDKDINHNSNNEEVTYVAKPYDQKELQKQAAEQKLQALKTRPKIESNYEKKDQLGNQVSDKISKMNRPSSMEYYEEEFEEETQEENISEIAEDYSDNIDYQNNSQTRKLNNQKSPDTKKVQPKNDAVKKTAKKVATKQKTAVKTVSKTGGKAATKQVAQKAGSKALAALLKHPWVLVAIGVVILLLFLIILIVVGGAQGAESEGVYGYMDPAYDFNETVVTLNDGSGQTEIDELMLEDLILGAAYAEIYNEAKNLEDDKQKEVYKVFSIVAKSLALSMGNYDSSTKEITIQNGTGGLPSCDVYNGCKVIENNGIYTYVSADYNGTLPGNVIKIIEPMPDDAVDILVEAYEETKYEILVPKDLNEILTKYTYGNVSYTQKLKQEWVDAASEGETYDLIITGTDEYKNHKIYNIKDYGMYYNYADGSAYWWPIGGSSENNGIYAGTPTVTYVSSKYGWRTISGKRSYHKGIDIASNGCSSHVIVATRGGTVTAASDGCASVGSYGNKCGGGYGNYVIIDHGDGTSSVYAHMYKNSVSVKVGDQVAQGQKLGTMGSSGSSTGCHLHFEIRVNNEQVDPLQYISAENPRSTVNVTSGYAQGSSNVQTVCLSLKQSGFSDNAVAAILVNMQAESGFRLNALGDNGTSYGLCQWHNGRYTKLRNYCGSELNTVKCQLSYLIQELQNSYKGVYNYLLTNNSAYDMAKYYCLYFEVPANRERTCTNRANQYSNNYSNYVKNGCQ